MKTLLRSIWRYWRVGCSLQPHVCHTALTISLCWLFAWILSQPAVLCVKATGASYFCAQRKGFNSLAAVFILFEILHNWTISKFKIAGSTTAALAGKMLGYASALSSICIILIGSRAGRYPLSRKAVLQSTQSNLNTRVLPVSLKICFWYCHHCKNVYACVWMCIYIYNIYIYIY